MKIAVVVHGRFHAFDLVRELVAQGVDVLLVTNYPKAVARRYAIPPDRVLSAPSHGIATRVIARLAGNRGAQAAEPFLDRWFSRFAVRALASRQCTVVHAFSGVAEELFAALIPQGVFCSLVRGSAHIEVQDRLLEEEERRAGARLERPSRWKIERELREYRLAQAIFVLSSFAYDSFVERGVPREKLVMLALGAQLDLFRPQREVIEERRERILSGAPLRVLTVGTFSYQKGILDFTRTAASLAPRCTFRFVGTVAPEGRALARAHAHCIEFVARVEQSQLPAAYAWGDVFLFQTIQDGYAVVLAQAQAAGLPVLATTNCAAPDMIEPGVTGWVLPIRSPEAFVERLRWCDANRAALARMATSIHERHRPRDWSDVARDLVGLVTRA